ncbi:CapA family protein [Candidatus Peregrinibacteria bacterium]|jgi:hypothetical protein|nr:CapA family protein [Candidatus Peregrinibacteria bacterium]MBT7736688.1 CapA family protein [Candidatus Peregrinibacteria bacterium]
MNKVPILIAFLVAVVSVFQVQSGRIGLDDIFSAGGFDIFIPTFESDPYKGDLKVMAFGDMMMGRYVRTLMDRNGMEYPFENLVMPDFFDYADVRHANLEGPLKGEGRSGGTSTVFQFNEDIAPYLKKHDFDVVSISNNHAVDVGWDSRDTTIAALDAAGVGWCGHPTEADPASIYYGAEAGSTYAFVCLHDATINLDYDAAVNLIEYIDGDVDYVIVSIHWGYEYQHKPSYEKQVEHARSMVDAGADFIIGHHPHVVQSFEVYNDRFIFYSLGNFIFDQYWSTETQEQLAIGIVFDDTEEDMETEVHLYPMKSEKSQVRMMEGEELSSWYEEFISYSGYPEEAQEGIRSGFVENSMFDM